MGGWSHQRAQEACWGGRLCVCVTETELEQGQDRRKARWADRVLRGQGGEGVSLTLRVPGQAPPP